MDRRARFSFLEHHLEVEAEIKWVTSRTSRGLIKVIRREFAHLLRQFTLEIIWKVTLEIFGVLHVDLLVFGEAIIRIVQSGE